MSNTFPQQELEHICKMVDKIDVFHHIEILKIIVNHSNVAINDNTYGTFINLTLLSDEVINKIKEYLTYVHIQENEIKLVENKKNEYINNFFPNKAQEDDNDTA